MNDDPKPKPTITDRALAQRILFGGLPDDYELALDRAAAIIAAYREEEVQEALGHVREIMLACREHMCQQLQTQRVRELIASIDAALGPLTDPRDARATLQTLQNSALALPKNV